MTRCHCRMLELDFIRSVYIVVKNKLEEFYFGLSLEKGLDGFVHYFKTYKKGQIKYHVTKVLACELCNDLDFFNTKIRRINTLIKQWQEDCEFNLFTSVKEHKEVV